MPNTHEKNFLRLILDSMGAGVMVLDKSFKVTMYNKSAERITGFTESEVTGKYCKYVFHADLCLEDCPLAKALRTGKNMLGYDVVINTKKNEHKNIQANTSVILDDEGEPTGSIITFREKDSYRVLLDKISSLGDFDGMIGKHPSMLKIFDMIENISDSDFSVLITGESGTGKEMVADSIQKRSKREDKPFVKVNCSVFPETLLSSELFGHVKGAFTDARSDRVGRFELADTGTIFLDEIGEMPPALQVRLLRVLQDGTFERIGESLTRYSDVRIIAATNKNLEKAIENGEFREDLYYRLNVIPIDLPPLRDRSTDIKDLVSFFINKYNILTGKAIEKLDKEALDFMLECEWPGNIRQLENTIEYAFAFTKGKTIVPSALPKHSINNKPNGKIGKSVNLNNEADRLRQALEENHWNKNHTAEELGMSRTTLWRKLRKYKIL